MSFFKDVRNIITNQETLEGKLTRYEEEKLIETLKEKMIETQDDYISNMKCSICGNDTFIKGTLWNYGYRADGYVYEVTTNYKDYKSKYKTETLICATCGKLEIFANFKTEKSVDK